MKFKLYSRFQPTGDQPTAIDELVTDIESGKRHNTLLGVTGSGKSLGHDDLVYVIKRENSVQTAMHIQIGELIDTYFAQNKSSIQKINDTELCDIRNTSAQYFTESYNPQDGTVSLKQITSFTRHSPHKSMFKLSTTCGRSATFTGDHNFWVLRNGTLKLIKTSEANQKDYLPIPESIHFCENSVIKISLIETLRGQRFFIDEKQIIKKYIEKNGVTQIAQSMYEVGIKQPYSKLSAIRNNLRGSAINIGIFQKLIEKTNNFDQLWDPKKSRIISKSRKHTLPVTITINTKWLRFFGYFIAEGCTQKRYSTLANADTGIRSFIESFLSSEVNTPFLIRPSGDYQISSNLLNSLLKIACGEKADNKHLPPFWANLDKKQLGLLLQAYYDGDGTVSKNGEIITATKSEKLAYELTYALLKFGIWARIQKKWKRATNTNHKGNFYYYVILSGQENLRAFNKNIGFSLKYKADRLFNSITKQSNTNRDIIPHIGKKLFWLRTKIKISQSELVINAGIGRSALSMIENGHRSPSREHAKLIIQSLKNSAEKQKNENIEWWNNWNELNKLTSVYWTQIKSVEPIKYSKPHVYDFTVPGSETFLAGSGGFFVHNTFTMANVIEKIQKPTLIVAHNKTLAAQLYQEFRDFFPENAVSYFVSYYDYYQPEAYIPTTDTYIEKESTINDEIDKLRLSATTNLLTRPDCIVIASVSCIYNLGSPVEYGKYTLELVVGQVISRETLLLQLANLQYDRSETEFARGTYRIRGDSIQLWPAYEDKALRIDTFENTIESIKWIDPISGSVVVPDTSAIHHSYNPEQKRFIIYPAKHYMMDPKSQSSAIAEIKADLQKRVGEMRENGKIVEAYRLEQKVNYDLEQMQEFGFVNGIENYSRYFDKRQPGEPPFTLIDYLQHNADEFSGGKFLTIIDESHMTLPQIKGMFNGDQARKQTLIEYGFRLPSALENRPLTIDEFMSKTDIMTYVSATPNETEIRLSDNKVVEQLIRPTGLVDPTIELRPTSGQIEDLVVEVIKRKQLGQRTLVTTLTKKMAEALTDYLNDKTKIDALIASYKKRNQDKKTAQELGELSTTIWQQENLPIDQMEIGPIEEKYFSHLKNQVKTVDYVDLSTVEYPKVAYLHSDIDTLERLDILDDLRRGEYDVVVGINLLREGLDLPEVSLVAILDADKEGFLRSRTSMIQTMGRGARHVEGHAILYADRMTGSMKAAIEETLRRRKTQIQYNVEHDIDPQTISKPIREKLIQQQNKKKKKKGSGLDPESEDHKMIVSLNKGEQIDLLKIKPEELTPDDKIQLSKKLQRRMNQAVKDMDFELAAIIRDILVELR